MDLLSLFFNLTLGGFSEKETSHSHDDREPAFFFIPSSWEVASRVLPLGVLRDPVSDAENGNAMTKKNIWNYYFIRLHYHSVEEDGCDCSFGEKVLLCKSLWSLEVVTFPWKWLLFVCTFRFGSQSQGNHHSKWHEVYLHPKREEQLTCTVSLSCVRLKTILSSWCLSWLLSLLCQEENQESWVNWMNMPSSLGENSLRINVRQEERESGRQTGSFRKKHQERRVSMREVSKK